MTCDRGKSVPTNVVGQGRYKSSVVRSVDLSGVLSVKIVVVSKDFRRATLGSRGQCGSVHDTE